MPAAVRRTPSGTLPYVVALLLVLLAFPVLTAAPALAARTITISITADGPKPAAVNAEVGDTIVFKNVDATFIHQARSASTNWSFNTGPLAPGAQATAGKLSKPGEYLYEGVNLDSFKGKVVVPAVPAPAPAGSSTPAPKPAGSAPPGSSGGNSSPAASPTASPASTGGSGSAGGPSLGGFGSVGGPQFPVAPSAGAPAPNVAPLLPGEVLPSAGATAPAGPVVVAAPGRLPSSATARRYGLPAALAAVAAAGVASLLVRLLLAHPAARARRRTARPGQLVDQRPLAVD